METQVSIELIEEHHAASLFQLIQANQEHLGEWLPWVPHMRTSEQFDNFISGAIRRNDEGLEMSGVIIVDDEIVGRIGLYYLDLQHKHASLGYWIAAPFQGRGIVTEACRQLIRKGFEEMNLNRIELKCGTENDRSRKIAERLGFTREGLLRQAELVNGHYIDHLVFSLLRQEWQA